MKKSKPPTKSGGRQPGKEFRPLIWLARNPIIAGLLAGLTFLICYAGLLATAYTVGGLSLAVLIWGRAHPATFDRWAAPRVRAILRRYWSYRGGKWAEVLEDCELTRENRRTGHVEVPRLIKVMSPTPSIDVLHVKPVRGQDLRTWTDQADALTDALDMHRVALAKKRPGRLIVVVERENPFALPVPPPEIPAGPEDVDPAALEVGEDEYGELVTVSVDGGEHVLTVGASGSGKNGSVWNPLRAAGPLIRDGWLRVWVVDLKNGTETALGEDLFHEWAIGLPDALELVRAFRANMKAKQDRLREMRKRTMPISAAWPGDLLIIDELAMATAYGEPSLVRDMNKILAEIATQGRATKDSLNANLQEPTKDVVGIRDLFTKRFCLAVTSANHVDMTLGDGARDRGALADEIPLDEEHAGIGFHINKGSRLPRRLRLGFTRDEDVTELVKRCAPRPPHGLAVVRGPKEVA